MSFKYYASAKYAYTVQENYLFIILSPSTSFFLVEWTPTVQVLVPHQ